MWKCGICGTQNDSGEKFCVFCGGECAEKRHKFDKTAKIKSALSAFLTPESCADIYAAAPDANISEKAKPQTLKNIFFITKAIVLACIPTLIIFGFFSVFKMNPSSGSNKYFDAFTAKDKFEHVKNNFTAAFDSKHPSAAAQWQDKTANLKERTAVFSGSFEKKTGFLTVLREHIAGIPDKCAYYRDEIINKINKIIGGREDA